MPHILKGRRILITRTRAQASILAHDLERLGAIPIIIPSIEIAPPLSFESLDAALCTLDRFDWLLFTSTNAVHAFARRSRALGLHLKPRNVAAVGPATAQALAAEAIPTDSRPVLLPPIAVAESLADVLLSPITELCRAKGSASLALFRAESARDVLPQQLRTSGALVACVPTYRTILPSTSVTAMRTIFADPAHRPHAATFTSSSTATNLLALLEAADTQLSEDILRVSIGPITSATLQDIGFPAHAEAAEANIASLIHAITDAFTSHKPQV